MIGIIYGSSTLNTEYVAQKVHRAFGSDVAELHNVAAASPELLSRFAALVLVTSTWGRGDLQDDWERFFPHLDRVECRNKPCALVGLGDQENYPDNFCDSIIVLHQKLTALGAVLVGATPTADYKFKSSKAVVNGRFVGLVIDEDSQSDKTDDRVRDWVGSVKPLLLGAAKSR